MGEATRTAHPQRLLVATDCLSEGINLQPLFDTVVHYDLSWNPTRHQQREGRVDRFGQPAKLVRSVLLFSPDSAIDGAVLEVILRKAEAIRKPTGVTVPLPDERGAVTGALMNAVMLRKGRARQLSLDFGLDADTAAMETRWRDAEEGERRSRARFAQNAMRPEEVAPEWQRWRDLLGAPIRGPSLRRTRDEPVGGTAGARPRRRNEVRRFTTLPPALVEAARGTWAARDRQDRLRGRRHEGAGGDPQPSADRRPSRRRCSKARSIPVEPAATARPGRRLADRPPCKMPPPSCCCACATS